MGYIKTFSEFINESFSPIKDLANNIYAALEKGYSGNFGKPMRDDETPYLASVADYNGELFKIIFTSENIFDNDRFDFYAIYVADNAPIDPDNGVSSSLWIEYGEKGYTDGREPWCLYYDAENDTWDSTGDNTIFRHNRIMNVIGRITSIVNPHTEYVLDEEDSFDDKTLEDLYHYLLENYENLGKEEILFNKGKDADGIWYELTIPVTLSGLKLETEPYVGRPGETFAIDINPELEQYLESDTYDEIDDEILDEHGVLRVFTGPDEVTNEDILNVLDGLLKNVPDPVLRKK